MAEWKTKMNRARAKQRTNVAVLVDLPDKVLVVVDVDFRIKLCVIRTDDVDK